VNEMEVPIELIRPSPYQPRLYFELETIKESVRQDGMLVVPLVRRKPDGKTEYELIDGERRWRATQELGWKTIQVQIVDVNDETTRRMVFTLNEERQPYTTEEYTKFFRRMYEQMGSVYAVSKALRKPQPTVWRYIDISMLPEHLQKAVWAGRIPIGFIKELEPVFTDARDEIGDITYTYKYSESPSYQKIVAWCERIYTKQIQSREELRKEYVDPYLERLDKVRIEKAKEEIEKTVPAHLTEAKVSLETPEELERAAEALRREAERRKTPKQKAEEKKRKLITQARKSFNSIIRKINGAEKIIDVSVFRKRLDELNKSLGQNPEKVRKQLIALGKEVMEAKKRHQREIEEEKRKKREEEERHRLEEEMRRKLEEEKRRIEEEAKAKAREELLGDTEFIREFIKKEYPLMPETIKTENLEKELMQRLIASIPEEKRERAKEIFREEFRSLQKRLDIFPEKSEKMEPKFERLRLLKDRGVIPYTVWDFPYRDDYAGDKEFHGNCSPQIIEQCIWRLTDEGDLVVDPMAGSGTALGVCKKFNRRCIGYDIKPPENRPDIVQNDSRKVPLEDESVDMVFIHPPYWNLTHYTKAEENLPDLSRAKTVEEYSAMIKQVFKECYRILKHGKFMCVLLGDLIRGGRFISLCREATNVAEEIGFMDYGYAVKLAHGEVSRKKSGVIVAEPVYTHNLKISHDLVIFLRKPEHHGD